MKKKKKKKEKTTTTMKNVSVSLGVYLRDGPAETILRAATLR